MSPKSSFYLICFAAALGCSGAGALPGASAAKQGPPDVDEDGIADADDECITEKEDGLAPRPKDGCKTNPDDPDGDNIAKLDECPDRAENINGYEDEDGCPDALPEVVVDEKKQEIRCDAKILFAAGQAQIKDVSDELVAKVAKALQDHPEIQFVEVAGHADQTGSDALNVELTKKRAQAVVDALIAKGVEATRLRAAGYGRYCPIDPSGTDAAREVNRRVEFKVMLVGGEETGVPVGCPKAVENGLRPEGVPKTAPRGTKTST